MIEAELRRHSIKDGPRGKVLGPMGFERARMIGSRFLRGREFVDYTASAWFRTHQTLAAMSEGAGDFGLMLAPEKAPFYCPDVPEMRDLYRACGAAEDRGEDVFDAALAFDRALVERVSQLMAARFTDWLISKGEGARVLHIGHSPEIEFIPYALLGVKLPCLQSCQGFRLFLENGVFRLEHDTPDLNIPD